jgi:hypothetical protein
MYMSIILIVLLLNKQLIDLETEYIQKFNWLIYIILRKQQQLCQVTNIHKKLN